MKAGIHPQFVESKIICSCGNSFVSHSTKSEIHVEVCYKCHPLYTGEHRFIDTKGRVEKFQKKQADAKRIQDAHSTSKNKQKINAQEGPKTLKELLSQM